MRTLALILLASLPALAAPVPKEVKNKTDAERFVGTWETVVSEASEKPYSKALWTLDESLKMVSNPLPGNAGGRSEWVINIDPKAVPKTIDIGSYQGVYEFDGPDIRIAYNIGGSRPASAVSKGSQYFCLLRRVPEKKQ